MVHRGHGIGRLARGPRGLAEECGAVATEYGLLLALVALAITVALAAFGFALLDLFRAGVDAFP